jgi:hypothetical protein
VVLQGRIKIQVAVALLDYVSDRRKILKHCESVVIAGYVTATLVTDTCSVGRGEVCYPPVFFWLLRQGEVC